MAREFMLQRMHNNDLSLKGESGSVDQRRYLMSRSFLMLFVCFQAMQRAIYMQENWVVLATLVWFQDRTDASI